MAVEINIATEMSSSALKIPHPPSLQKKSAISRRSAVSWSLRGESRYYIDFQAQN